MANLLKCCLISFFFFLFLSSGVLAANHYGKTYTYYILDCSLFASSQPLCESAGCYWCSGICKENACDVGGGSGGFVTTTTSTTTTTRTTSTTLLLDIDIDNIRNMLNNITGSYAERVQGQTGWDSQKIIIVSVLIFFLIVILWWREKEKERRKRRKKAMVKVANMR